jgi:hypothetical protein
MIDKSLRFVRSVTNIPQTLNFLLESKAWRHNMACYT